MMTNLTSLVYDKSLFLRVTTSHFSGVVMMSLRVCQLCPAQPLVSRQFTDCDSKGSESFLKVVQLVPEPMPSWEQCKQT